MKNKIKVYRAMYDLTQEELAKKVSVTRQTIIAIESGKYNPSLELAFKIARALNAKDRGHIYLRCGRLKLVSNTT